MISKCDEWNTEVIAPKIWKKTIFINSFVKKYKLFFRTPYNLIEWLIEFFLSKVAFEYLIYK